VGVPAASALPCPDLRAPSAQPRRTCPSRSAPAGRHDAALVPAAVNPARGIDSGATIILNTPGKTPDDPLRAGRPSTLRRLLGSRTGLGVGVLAISALAFATFRHETVNVALVEEGPLRQAIVASGRVRTPERIVVSAQIAGRVQAVEVREGDALAPGRALLRLDEREWQAAVAQAGAAVVQGEARLRQLRELGLPVAEQALRQAEATALQAQRDFTADAAHELRSPLTALSLQVQLLERAHDATGRAAALAELRGGIARAVHLVDQLLKLARLGPEVGSATEPVRLAELAARVLAEHAPLATAKAIDLGLGEVDPGLSVRGDPAGLRLLLSNLVGNAVRYTPDGGRVDVSVLAEGPQAWLVVSDTGPGIPADERGRVFDRFYRRPGETAEGSGLGLAIVRAVADRHGADVRLGVADGGGLRVEVRFPPAAA